MFSLNYKHIKEELQKAILQSQNNNDTLLFTYTWICENIHPILFLTNNKALFQGKRFFYTNKAQTEFKVGIGHTKVFELHNESDLSSFQSDLKQLKNYHYNGGNIKKSPLFFGGLPFFMNEQAAIEWSDFKRGYFVLPFLLLETNETTEYLTVSKMITPTTTIEEVVAELKEAETSFTLEWNKEQNENIPPIIHKEETPINQWQSWVRQVKTGFAMDEVEKVVLARRKHITYNATIPIEQVIENLLTYQHNSYVFLFEAGMSAFVGASPENLIMKKGEMIHTMALAGSVKRGKNIKEDQLLSQYLLSDEKNLWEHELVVRSIVEVLESFKLEPVYNNRPGIMKMKDIQHLHTKIEAKNNESSLIEFIQKLHPTPALGGYPKKEACQLIEKIENYDRGLYAAPLGWLTLDDEGEFFVSLRSGLIRDKEVYLYAGCGLVQHSDPLLEFDETETKFKPMLRALGVEV